MHDDFNPPKITVDKRQYSTIHYIFITILIGAALYAAAKISLAFSFAPDYVAVFWLPNTVILTALALMRTRLWWICFLAMAVAYFPAAFQAGYSEQRAIIFYIANCAEVLIAAVALLCLLKKRLRFTRLFEIIVFIGFAVIIAPAISASIASLATFRESGAIYWQIWRVWFLGDALGHLTLTPALLTWIIAGSTWFKTVSWQRFVEGGVLTVGLIAVGPYAFGSEIGSPGNIPTPAYTPLPLLLWTAVRFGPQGTYTAIFGITLLSIWNAVEGRGPFITMTPADNVLSLQLFLGTVAIPLMFLTTLICERKKAEHKLLERTQELTKANTALKESEARYADLYDNSPDMYVSVSADTARIIQCNQTFAEKLGYNKEELVDRPIADMHHMDCMAEARKAFQSFLETGAIHDTELQFKRRDGGKIDVNLNATSVRDKNGKIIYSRSCCIDTTTARKKADASLHESEERYRSIFNTASDAILIIDKNEDILEINPAACNTYGYKRNELLDMKISQLIIPEYYNTFSGFVHNIDKEGFFQGEIIEVRKDGSTLNTEVRGATITFHDKECIIAVVRDVSMRKQAEEEKAKLEFQLRQAQKMEAIGTLAGGIAHDFNNILSPIIGFTELAMTDFDEKDSAKKRFLEQIYLAGLRARELVKQILAFSRQSKRELQPIQPHLVIKEALKLIRSSIPTTIDIRSICCGKENSKKTEIKY